MSILKAWALDGKGGGVRLNGDAVLSALEANKTVWVHLDASAASTKSALMKLSAHFDSDAISSLTAKDTRPRVLKMAKGLLINMRTVNFNNEHDLKDMVSVRLWMDHETVLSVRMRKLRETQVIEQKIEQGIGPSSTDGFLVSFVEEMVISLEQQLAVLVDLVDQAEIDLVDGALDLALRKRVMALRQQTIAYRRYLIPQRDVLASLLMSGNDVSFISSSNQRKLQELHDQVTRHAEDIDVLRERTVIIGEEITSSYAERQNRNMYILSLVAAIFLPLSFMTGLLGVNIGGIPGQNVAGAFAIFCGVLILVVALQVYIFKKYRWL